MNYRQQWWYGPWGGLMFLWICPAGMAALVVLFFVARWAGLITSQ